MASFDQDRIDDDRREREAAKQDAYYAYCDEHSIDPDDEDSAEAFEDFLHEEARAAAEEQAEDRMRERMVWAERDEWEVIG